MVKIIFLDKSKTKAISLMETGEWFNHDLPYRINVYINPVKMARHNFISIAAYSITDMEIMDNPLIKPGIINLIRDTLVNSEETIAVAESVTSGLVQTALSQAIDASKFYQGGITTYNIGQKFKHLNVAPIHASHCDCISEKVAAGMALHGCTLFGSHWGLGITGYASVVPEKNNDLMAHYAIAYRQKIKLADKIVAPAGTPYHVQLFYMRKLINVLKGYLEKEYEPG